MTQEQITIANDDHKVGDIYQGFGYLYKYLGESNGNHIFKPLGDTIFIKSEDGNVPFYGFPASFKKVGK